MQVILHVTPEVWPPAMRQDNAMLGVSAASSTVLGCQQRKQEPHQEASGGRSTRNTHGSVCWQLCPQKAPALLAGQIIPAVYTCGGKRGLLSSADLAGPTALPAPQPLDALVCLATLTSYTSHTQSPLLL